MKKFFPLLLSLALCLGLSVPALAAGFSDVPATHYAAAAIDACVAKGIASGYSDATFKPAAPVTRAQFCVMLCRAFFSDWLKTFDTVESQAQGWFVPYTTALYNLDPDRGALAQTSFENGYLDSAVMGQPINRYDMAQLMSNIMSEKNNQATDAQRAAAQAKIGDWSSVPERSKYAVASCYALGILGGQSDGAFGGNNAMNRAQACVVIDRMMKYMSGKAAAPETPTVSVAPAAATAGNLTNGKPITVANVTEMLAELKKKLPDSTDFSKGYAGARSSLGLSTSMNGTLSPVRTVSDQYWSTNNLKTSTTFGCGGWAAFVADYLFGQDVTFRKTTVENVRPGDIVIHLNTSGLLTHVGIVQTEPTVDPYSIYFGSGGTIADGEWDYYVTRQFLTTDAGTDANGVYHIAWDQTHAWTVDRRNPGVMFGDNSYMRNVYEYYTCYPD